MLQNINPFLNYTYQKLSKYSLIGIGLILCALMLFTFEKVYQQKKLALTKAELTEITKQKKLLEQQKLTIKSPSDIYGVLNLPKKTELHHILEFIHTSAKQNNLFVDQVNYKLTELPAIDSLNYEITFPVTGGYLDIRKFISQVSQMNSGVVFQNIELSRDNNQINDLDGLLQFTIYLKS